MTGELSWGQRNLQAVNCRHQVNRVVFARLLTISNTCSLPKHFAYLFILTPLSFPVVYLHFPFVLCNLSQMERQKKQKDSEDADSFVGSFSIPCDETEWAALVLKGRIRGKTLHGGTKMSSGSKVLKKQFLLFRVLWPQRVEPDGFLPCIDKYGLDKTWDRATTIVDGSAELQRYISLVANKVDVKTLSETDESGAGSFIPVLPFQQQCLVPVERVSTERHTISHETRLKRKAAEIFGLLRPSASGQLNHCNIELTYANKLLFM